MLRSTLEKLARSRVLPVVCVAGLGAVAQAQTSAYICKDDGRHWLHRNITAVAQTLTLTPLQGSDKTFNVVVKNANGTVAMVHMFSGGGPYVVPLAPGQRAVIVDVTDGNIDPAFGFMTIS